MVKYNYYRISTSTVDDKLLKYVENYLENNSNNVAINFKNTSFVSMHDIELLERLKNSNRVFIRIEGGYDDSRVNNYTADIYVNMHKYDNIYSLYEMKLILKEINKIEQGINSNWSTEQKLLYFIGYLKEKIIYHPFFETAPSKDIRSLRGLFSHKTVCAGYAMILKELCDRNGISCQYVEGACNKKDSEKGWLTHAWNIVNLNGRNIPIDLTWTASKSKSGKLLDVGDLANVNEFIRTHIPGQYEKIQNYEKNLTSIDGKYLRVVSSLINKDRTFDTSRFEGSRKDGTRYSVTLVREEIIENEYLYAYVYQRILNDNTYSEPIIFYSKTNIALTLSRLKQKRKLEKELQDAIRKGDTKKADEYRTMLKGSEYLDGIEDRIDNLLFSKLNMVNALKRRDYYLGEIKSKKNEKDGTSYVDSILVDLEFGEKNKREQRTIKRNDGTSFVLERWGTIHIDGCHVYRYRLFETVKENNVYILKQNTIFTDEDIINDYREGIANDFLSRSRIERKAKETGGYLGFYSKEGIRTYNPNTNRVFKEGIYNYYRIKPDVFRDYYPELTFEDMKRMIKVYDLVYYDDGHNRYAEKIVNKNTNEVITDERIKKQVRFSYLWLNCAGNKHYANEEIPGYSYAFEVDSAQSVFNVINRCITDSIVKFGTIKPIEVYESVKKKCGNYKYAEEIAVAMLKSTSTINILKDFYFMQNPSSVNMEAPIEPLIFDLDAIARRKEELERQKSKLMEIIENNNQVEMVPYTR
ncbi:MAG TPA: hypothetical protein DCE23_01075 [Firmicutes bacterium]|nr:hypothetical protein [Bacillota bacterium]